MTPLPSFNWADCNKIWSIMSKNDELYKRDGSIFSGQHSLQPIMRSTLLDWLNEVSQAYGLTRQTYYLALDFFDRYLSVEQDVPKKRLQLIGITCLFIASKIEEICPPRLDRFSFVCDGACNEAEILKQELVIMHKLEWKLNTITPISWLYTFMQIQANADKENVNHQSNESFLVPNFQQNLFIMIGHLIDLCTLDLGSLSFSYAVIAATALYHFTNENVLFQCSGMWE